MTQPNSPALNPKPAGPTAPATTAPATTTPRATAPAPTTNGGQAPTPASTVRASPFKVVSPRRQERWLKGLVYGPFGAGKTTLWGTAMDVPEMRDVLGIDAEAGDLSLINRPDLDIIKLDRFAVFARIHEFLRSHCKARDEDNVKQLRALEAYVKGLVPEGPVDAAHKDQWLAELIPTPKRYRFIGVDSLTEIQKYKMYSVLGVNPDTFKLDDDVPQPQWADWGNNAESIRLLIRTLRDLPMHVMFVAQEQESEDDLKRKLKRPNLPGKLAWEVQGFLDFVGYYTMVQVPGDPPRTVRRLYVKPTGRFQAKNRFVGFEGDYLDDPTMQTIQDLITKYYVARQP